MNYTNTLFDLTNKNIIIFGGAGQIGVNSTEILLNAGAKVQVFDVLESDEFFDTILLDNDFRKNLTYVKLDVTDEEAVRSASDRVSDLDVLLNHVHFKGDPRNLTPGLDFFSALENYPYEAWQQTVNTNLNGLFLLTKHFGKKMIKSGGGSIINTSSTYGMVSPRKDIYGGSGINSPIPYATTKAAILNFSRYVATHWAEYNIRSNCLSPGGVENDQQSDEFKSNYKKNTPLNRMASPKDYQGAVLYLASDASSYMTGANLVVDGGWTAW